MEKKFQVWTIKKAWEKASGERRLSSSQIYH